MTPKILCGLAISLQMLLVGAAVGPFSGWLILAGLALGGAFIPERPQRRVGSLPLAIAGGIVITYLVLHTTAQELTLITVWGHLVLGVGVILVIVWLLAGLRGREIPLLALLSMLFAIASDSTALTYRYQAPLAFAFLATWGLITDTIGRIGSSQKVSVSRMGSLFMMLAAVLGATTFSAEYIENALPGIRKLADDSFREIETRGRVLNPLTSSYVTAATLDSVTQQSLTNPETVVLRVYAQLTPGYFRGRAYTHYRSGRWHDVGNDAIYQTLLPLRTGVESSSGLVQGSEFQVAASGRGRRATFEVEHEVAGGQVYFGPLGVSRWTGVGNRLKIDVHRIPRGGLDLRSRYATQIEEISAEDPLDESLRIALVQLPRGIQAYLQEKGAEIVGAETRPRVIASRISHYLQNRFSYSFDSPSAPPGEDPVQHLLTAQHPAHCEYFASASCLLLRAAGVPARYVTGFVIDEADEDEEGSWLARNRDLHAWTEAYDDSQQKWFIVEATPGQEIVQSTFAEGQATANVDQVKSESQIKQESEWTVIELRAGIQALIAELLRPRSLIVLLAGLGFLLGTQRFTAPQAKKKRNREIQRLDGLAKKLGYVRLVHEPFESFAVRLEGEDFDPASPLAELATCYRRESRRCYGR